MPNIILNDGRTLFKEVVFDGKVTLNPSSISAGEVGSEDITVTGAQIGDFVLVGPPYDLGDVALITAFVSATNTVTINIYNGDDTDPLDLGEGNWNIKVLR